MVHPCPLLLTVCESYSHHCWDKLPQAQWLKVTDLLSCKSGSQKSMGRHGSVPCRGSQGVHLLLEATPAPCLVALIPLSPVIPLPPSGITMWVGVFVRMKIWTSLGRLCLSATFSCPLEVLQPTSSVPHHRHGPLHVFLHPYVVLVDISLSGVQREPSLQGRPCRIRTRSILG